MVAKYPLEKDPVTDPLQHSKSKGLKDGGGGGCRMGVVEGTVWKKNLELS